MNAAISNIGQSFEYPMMCRHPGVAFQTWCIRRQEALSLIAASLHGRATQSHPVFKPRQLTPLLFAEDQGMRGSA
jgi:hypothetical protein